MLFKLKTRLINLLAGWMLRLGSYVTLEPYIFFRRTKLKIRD